MYRATSFRACSRVGYTVRLTRSTFTAASNDSACALSKHTPVRPTERRIPSAAVLLANACEVYWETLNAGSSSDVLGPILVHPVSPVSYTHLRAHETKA